MRRMLGMCCPHCNGVVAVMSEGVVVCRVTLTPQGRALSFYYGTIALCLSCPMTTEVTPEGRCVDLGKMTLKDLDGVWAEMPVTVQEPAAVLHGRKDS